MSAEIVSDGGGILVARIVGRLTQPELSALQAAARDSIRRQGEIRILVIVEDFEGWREGDDWSDVAFMDSDPHIRKMAIVGDRRWEELALIFAARPVRSFPIEYFGPAELERARAWLAAE